ncbi:hypothetical protein LI169_18930, partial [Desulfovibrio desulfuricans]|nr:hypothetical protein [Desulfovibrio desulfuricans]
LRFARFDTLLSTKRLAGERGKSSIIDDNRFPPRAYDGGIEERIPAVDATSNVVTVLSLIAPLFSVLTEAEYGDVSKIAMQPEVRDAA